MSIKADEASSLLFLKLGKPCRPRSSGLTPLFPVAYANHFGSPTLGNEAILLGANSRPEAASRKAKHPRNLTASAT